MKANFKPTLLASVIAAAIYAPPIHAAEITESCGAKKIPFISIFEPISKNYTFDDVCTIYTRDGSTDYIRRPSNAPGEGTSINHSGGNIKFNKQVSITRAKKLTYYDSKTKGMITEGDPASSIRFAGGLNASNNTESNSNELNELTNTRIVLVRHKDETSFSNGIFFSNNTNNTLTIGSEKEPADTAMPAGAAIENYHLFEAYGPDGKTTINNSGKVNGLAQYLGTMKFEQELEINSVITDGETNGRQNSAILVNGGQAIFNGVTTINRENASTTNIKQPTSTLRQGAGVTLRSNQYWDGFYAYKTSPSLASYDTTPKKLLVANIMPQAKFSKDLTIKTQDGAGIQLTHGSLEHTGTNATIDVSGAGHGIEATKDAGGALADSGNTPSQYNRIQLAGGTVSNKAQNELGIGLGANATITTADGDGINIAAAQNIHNININNAGVIKTDTTAGTGSNINITAASDGTNLQTITIDNSKTLTANGTGNNINISEAENTSAITLTNDGKITSAQGNGIAISSSDTMPAASSKTIKITNNKTITSTDGNAIVLSGLVPNLTSPLSDKSPDADKQAVADARTITITNDNGSILAEKGAAYLGSSYDESFTSNKGVLAGDFDFAWGSDNLTINGSNISKVGKLDGGDDETASDKWIDTLTLNNVTYAHDGSNIVNWETINLTGNTKLELTGDLKTDTTTGLNLDSGATLYINKTTPIEITGKVSNSGTIDLSTKDSNPIQSLTIKGDYTGNNGTIIFDGQLKGDNSQTDSLTITGSTSGKTEVEVRPTNPGDTGEATNQGIKLISVGGNSNQSHFTLQNPVQLTAYEYNILHYNPSNKVFFLQSKKNPSGGKKPVEGGKPKPAGSGNSNNANTTHSNTAYKPVDKPSKKIPDSVDTTPIPDVNNGNGSGSYKPELYRPAVATYSMAQFSNQDAINSLLGDQLHQRVGEQEVLRWDDKDAHNNQVWGRIRHNQLKLNGEQQFEVKQNTQLVQFGWDLDIHRNDQNSRQHSGLFAGFARADAEVSDRDRAFTKYGAFSGKAKGDIFNVGGYHTRYDEQGNYLDVIGGVHFVGNRYSDVYGGSSKQKGWGLSASVEGGIPRPIGDSEHWFIEPQAQLSWQMTQYKKFDDAVASIDGYTSQSLRPRIGVRVGYNDKSVNPEQPSKDFYATVSFAHELLDPAVVNIGGVDVIEKVNDDSWMEVGIGGQLPIGKSTYIYGSAQYQHTIGSDARSGVNGQIGVRYSW